MKEGGERKGKIRKGGGKERGVRRYGRKGKKGPKLGMYGVVLQNAVLQSLLFFGEEEGRRTETTHVFPQLRSGVTKQTSKKDRIRFALCVCVCVVCVVCSVCVCVI